jgi:hypothetical protein
MTITLSLKKELDYVVKDTSRCSIESRGMPEGG